MTKNKAVAVLSASALLFSGLLLSRAQEAAETPADETAPAAEKAEAVVDHAECSFFVRRARHEPSNSDATASAVTEEVVKRLGSSSKTSGLKSFAVAGQLGTIDKYLFAD